MDATRVTHDDPRYPTMVRGFNQRWVGRPRYIEVITDSTQVEPVLQAAVDADLRPVVRSSGHGYEGWAVLTDGVIIDVSALRDAGRDETTGRFFLEPGCTNWDVYDQIFRRYGRTLPAGSCYSVAAGGHICGGGYGVLSRLFGLTVDWLTAVEVVYVDRNRQVQRITAERDAADDHERDLFWAHTGGGGGNFGVVTKYYFAELPAAPFQACLTSVAWEWDDVIGNRDAFLRLLRNFCAFFEQNSGVGSPYSSLFALFHLTRKKAGQIVLTIQNVGGERGPVDIQPVLDLLAALQDGVDVERMPMTAPRINPGWHQNIPAATDLRTMTWLEATQTLNGSGANLRGKYKSAYMKRGFTEHQLATIWDYLTVDDTTYPGNANALLQIDSYGCAINQVGSDDTAVPQRDSILKLQYQTYWEDSAADSANLGWIRHFYGAMYGDRGPWPDDGLDGCYVNYPDVDLADWQYLYYKQSYPRLQRAKDHWDPRDVFRHQQSIRRTGDAT